MAAERCNHEVYLENPDMRSYDLAYYNDLMQYVIGDVLDLGCGAGMFINEYIKKPDVYSVTAIDKYIDEMPTHDKLVSIKQNIPDELKINGKFDTIVATEFVEHIEYDQLEPLLKKIKKLLKPTGRFIGSTPNKISPTTNPYHLYEYTLSELLSIYKNYFSEVEAWENGRHTTIWVAKL